MARVVPAGLVIERDGPVVIEDVVIDSPGPGEVLVQVRATGLCHSDLTVSRDAPVFPVVLGHEAAGVVAEVGAGVLGLSPGTPVVVAFKVPCGHCVPCRRGRQPWCEAPRSTAAPRVHRVRDGASVVPFLRVGSFCPSIVVPAGAAIPIPATLPFEQAALIGCGVATGAGAALFDARIEPGMDIALFGLGGVGLNVVQGAVLAQANAIIAVDIRPEKLDAARQFGATAGVLAGPDTAAEILALTQGRGVDMAFEAVGQPAVMAQALEALASSGALYILGAASREAQMSFAPRRLMSRQQSIHGDSYGACRPAEHFPLYARWALDGRLNLADLISRRLSDLHEINDAFAAMRRGEILRAVLLFPENAPW